MKAAGTELVCCREVDVIGRHGPCIAIAVAAAATRGIPTPKRATCDQHNRLIVIVRGAPMSAVAR